jgi:hypothetical protein
MISSRMLPQKVTATLPAALMVLEKTLSVPQPSRRHLRPSGSVHRAKFSTRVEFEAERDTLGLRRSSSILPLAQRHYPNSLLLQCRSINTPLSLSP